MAGPASAVAVGSRVERGTHGRSRRMPPGIPAATASGHGDDVGVDPPPPPAPPLPPNLQVGGSAPNRGVSSRSRWRSWRSRRNPRGLHFRLIPGAPPAALPLRRPARAAARCSTRHNVAVVERTQTGRLVRCKAVDRRRSWPVRPSCPEGEKEVVAVGRRRLAGVARVIDVLRIRI